MKTKLNFENYKMISYRITKYNPKKRDKNGAYKDKNEWTSISDIGSEKYGNVGFEAYKKVENSYVEAIKLILIEQKIDTVKVDSIEKNIDQGYFDVNKNEKFYPKLEIDFDKDIGQLKNGFEIGFWEIDKTIRLILREIIWMNLISKNIKIIFGYDFYMYIECEELKFETEHKICKMGLFVEKNIRQREVVITKKMN